MGLTKTRYQSGQLAWFDGTTYETVLPLAPFYWEDDFVTDAVLKAAGVPGWTLKDTGNATEVQLADASCGVFSLNLTNTNEKQYAGITHNNEHCLDLDKGPIIEWRAAIHTAPTSQAEAYFGVINDWVEGPYAEADAGATVHALFMFDGGLVCTIHTDDASTDNNAVATGITVLVDVYHVFRIDFTDVASVKFYIDGARVASGTTFSMANGANVMVQPFAEIHKETEVGVGSLYVDYCKIWQPTR